VLKKIGNIASSFPLKKLLHTTSQFAYSFATNYDHDDNRWCEIAKMPQPSLLTCEKKRAKCVIRKEVGGEREIG
jgi:hypothetical protein